jgi:hypothetical protein
MHLNDLIYALLLPELIPIHIYMFIAAFMNKKYTILYLKKPDNEPVNQWFDQLKPEPRASPVRSPVWVLKLWA